MSKTNKYLVSLAVTAVLTAVAVIISRFLSINLWNMSIGFSFVAIMLCGMLTGTIWGGVCGALTDFIGAILFPFGPYFPGFTATAFLSGVLFGVLGIAAKKIKSTPKFIALCIAVIVVKEVVCSLLLNTLWISMLYGSPFFTVFVTRIPLSAVTAVLETLFAVIVKASIIPALTKEKGKM